MATEVLPSVVRCSLGGSGRATEASPLIGGRSDLDGIDASATIYFAAIGVSVVGMSKLASQYFLKDVFHLDPGPLDFCLALASLGWVIKPAWGLVTDSCPILGLRRKPYLMLASGIAALACIGFGAVTALWEFLALLMLLNACMSFLSVIAQALMVQRSRNRELDVASFNFTSYFTVRVAASAVTTYGAGCMLEHVTARIVLMTAAVIFIGTLLSAACMSEKQTEFVFSCREQGALLHKLFQRREVWGVTAYIFVFCALPNAASGIFFFNVDVLHFGPQFIAMIAMTTGLAQVLGMMIYHTYLTQVPFSRLFCSATVLCAAISMTPLVQIFRCNRAWGIDDRVFALVDTFVIHAVGEAVRCSGCPCWCSLRACARPRWRASRLPCSSQSTTWA